MKGLATRRCVNHAFQPPAVARTLAILALVAASAVGWGQDWPQFRGQSRDGVVPGQGSLPAVPAGFRALLR